jgi:tetratricopeptide (TPR) repeat protein
VKVLQRNALRRQVGSVHRAFIAGNEAASAPSQAITHRPAKLFSLRFTLRVAASILLLVSVGFIYLYSTTTTGNAYTELYQPYTINTDRGFADPVPHDMVREFQAGDYDKVIRSFEALGATNNREKFLAAFSYLEKGNTDQAIQHLRSILEYNQSTGTRLYQDEAEFYLALAYLKKGDSKEALAWLTLIQQDPAHTFHARVDSWTVRRLKWFQ